MTTYRLGKPYTPRQPRGEPPASGFELWTWATGPDTWKEKTPAEIEADIRAVAGDALTNVLMAPYYAQREDECWRMFGVTVEYYHDERIISCLPPASAAEPTACPWCGARGVDFDEAPMPSDYCGHDPGTVIHHGS